MSKFKIIKLLSVLLFVSVFLHYSSPLAVSAARKDKTHTNNGQRTSEQIESETTTLTLTSTEQDISAEPIEQLVPAAPIEQVTPVEVIEPVSSSEVIEPTAPVPSVSSLITTYGASTSSSNNSAAINAAMANSSYVVVPEGTFKIQSLVTLKNGVTLEGTRGSSKIVIDETFVAGPYFPANEFAIVNEHFKGHYDSATADTITLRGITFVMREAKPSIKSILGLGNARNVVIEDCDFIVENSSEVEGNNLDIYVAVKGATVRNCYFKNDTGADEGCNIQVRCSSENLTDETSDVLIENNTFDKNGNDEVVAIYGWNGQVRNVTVRNNVIRTYGRVPNLIISVFTGETTSTLKDIFITGNQITTDNVLFTMFLIGRDGDSTRLFDNVRITGNTIKASVKSLNQGNTFIIFSGQVSNKTNVLIDGNTMTNTGSYPLTGAVYGPGEVSNNIIEGLFEYYINGATIDYGNTIINNITG